MIDTVPLAVLGRGFVKLNLILLPISLLLLVYISIMAGGAPNAPSAIISILTVAAFIFLTPAALALAQIASAKIFDGFLRLVPLMKAEISWIGMVFSAALAVVAANIFIDDLHQFNIGNYRYSVFAFFLDLAGIAAVVAAGGGKIPLVRHRL